MPRLSWDRPPPRSLQTGTGLGHFVWGFAFLCFSSGPGDPPVRCIDCRQPNMPRPTRALLTAALPGVSCSVRGTVAP